MDRSSPRRRLRERPSFRRWRWRWRSRLLGAVLLTLRCVVASISRTILLPASSSSRSKLDILRFSSLQCAVATRDTPFLRAQPSSSTNNAPHSSTCTFFLVCSHPLTLRRIHFASRIRHEVSALLHPSSLALRIRCSSPSSRLRYWHVVGLVWLAVRFTID
jgi:hypothetical protein